MYVVDPPAEAAPVRPPLLNLVVIGVLAGLVIVLGCAPNLVLARIVAAIHVSGL
jgi:hypothetical protein